MMVKFGLALLLFLIAPVAWSAAQYYQHGVLHWRDARWDSAGVLRGQIPVGEAVFQVYSARAWGKKGIVAVHSWVAFKRPGAVNFERYDVVGWGVSHGRDAIRRNMRPVDGRWAGNAPELIGELRGEAAAVAIRHADEVIANYPHERSYVTYPGPNSNSFVAAILRAVPQSNIALPVTAIGKDYLAGHKLFAQAPSGTGYQLSLFGLLGVTVAKLEGLEVNVLGMVFGVDPWHLGIKLPGVGRLSLR